MANPMYGQNKFDEKLDGDALWYLSKALDLTSTAAVYPVFNVPAGAYVLEVKVLVTSAITAGSMDIDIGDGDDADCFVNGWDGTAGSITVNSIHSFGISSSATEVGIFTGKYYSSADTIDVDINTVASAGEIKLLVLMADSAPQTNG